MYENCADEELKTIGFEEYCLNEMVPEMRFWYWNGK